MSTRAIVAIESLECGTGYVGSWQWNDGLNIFNDLKKNFKTLEDVQKLVGLGVWNTIFTRSELLKFFGVDTMNNINKVAKRRGYEVIKIKNRYILRDYKKHAHYFDVGLQAYPSIQQMMDQDVNVVYVFRPKCLAWEKFYIQRGLL